MPVLAFEQGNSFGTNTVTNKNLLPLPKNRGLAIHTHKFIMPFNMLQSELMIGISGMRGTIGGSLTPAVVSRMSAAFAAFLKSRRTSSSGSLKVVFGRDSRPSGTWVRDAAFAALVASGLEVVDLDVVTTPGVAMMVKHLSADAGVIATASHNPIEWNGLKFLNRDAVAPPPADAMAIADLYKNEQADFAKVEDLVPAR